MIQQFADNTALLLIDVHKGVDVLQHWGGPTGRRNNPNAEVEMASLLESFRRAGRTVAFTRHDSREAASPLKFSLPTGEQKDGFEPGPGDIVIEKDVNSGWVGEFCTALSPRQARDLLIADLPDASRVQGNE